jgi:hypothetical protein
VARQLRGPEAIGEGVEHTLEQGKHRFHPDAGAIQREGREGIEGEIATHEDNGSARGDSKEKAPGAFDGLPQQVEREIRDRFQAAIDAARGREKRVLVGLKDIFEFDFVALFPGASG